jgi:hypothetical protein
VFANLSQTDEMLLLLQGAALVLAIGIGVVAYFVARPFTPWVDSDETDPHSTAAE